LSAPRFEVFDQLRQEINGNSNLGSA